MKFARIVFSIAGIWGLLVLTALYFSFDSIGSRNPPPITHPEFYYGFVAVAIAWQAAFLVIARDPMRFRLMMVPAMLEKFGYAASLAVLFAQERLHADQLVGAAADLLLGVLFLAAFVKTRAVIVRS
ncbi:MAG: hypothetical protein ACRD3V_04395 [Vicinamibacteria bacterium]